MLRVVFVVVVVLYTTTADIAINFFEHSTRLDGHTSTDYASVGIGADAPVIGVCTDELPPSPRRTYSAMSMVSIC